MVMSTLIIIGISLGVFMGAMSNPLFYRAVFGGRKRSADHDDSKGL